MIFIYKKIYDSLIRKSLLTSYDISSILFKIFTIVICARNLFSNNNNLILTIKIKEGESNV